MTKAKYAHLVQQPVPFKGITRKHVRRSKIEFTNPSRVIERLGGMEKLTERRRRGRQSGGIISKRDTYEERLSRKVK